MQWVMVIERLRINAKCIFDEPTLTAEIRKFNKYTDLLCFITTDLSSDRNVVNFKAFSQ